MAKIKKANRSSQTRASAHVQKAVRNGHLKKLDGSVKCLDCGSPATGYDHRYYSRPFEVDPVCRSCNYKRGRAVDYGIVNFRKAGSLPLRIVKEVIRHSESFEAAAVNIGIHSSTLRRLIFGNSKPQRLTIRSILIQHEKIKKKVGV